MTETRATTGFLAGGGRMGALMRAHGWGATPLGDPETWPQSLRSTLSACLNSPMLGAVLWGPDLLFLYNDAYVPSLADRHPAALGRPVAEVWGEAWNQVAGPFHRAMASGEGFSQSRVPIAMERDGVAGTSWWNFTAAPIRGEDGRVAGLLNQGVEITAQVLAATALETERERLDQALSAGEGIGTWDWHVPTDTVRADARFARLYGVDPAKAERGAPLTDFFTRIHPDDLGHVQAAIDEALRTGDAFYDEYRLVQEDGRIVWLVAQGRCTLSAAGEPLNFPGVSFDITERKKTEQLRSALLDLSDVLRTVEDVEDMEFAGSTALARGLGAARGGYGTVDKVRETITIKRDWNAPGVRTLAGVLQFRDYGSYIEDLKRGDTVVIGDVDQDERTRSGADALKSISARSFINMPLVEQGDFVALAYVNDVVPRAWSEDDLIFMRDVAERVRTATERRRQSDALARLNETLEEQVATRTEALMAAEEALRQAQKMEAVGQLTGGIAHDFNNLLQGITGSLEIISRRIEQGRHADIGRFLTGATTAANRAAALTHRLLAFSRRQPLDPRSVRANALLASMEDLLRRTIGEHIDFELVLAGGLWPTLCDPNQLENAILNLAINARDAMPDGGKLTIETCNAHLDEAYVARQRGVRPGQYVCVCVTDTGTGMSEATIAKAFEPFFTTKPIGQGTGLGLSMIYGFAQQSEGYAKIYSELGQGTTFKLYLPRHLGQAEEEEPLPTLNEAHVSDAGEVVLVIEDEAVVRDLIVDTLGELGYRALEAADGPTGLKLLQSDRRIDLLITDIGLPGLNGRQVTEAARLVRPDLKVLFMTGYAENAALASGFLEHGMSMITKPFPMEALATRIRGIIEG